MVTFFGKKNLTDNVTIDKFNEDYTFEHISVKRKNLEGNLGLSLSSNLPLIFKILTQITIINDYFLVENPCSVSEAYELKPLIVDIPKEDSISEEYLRFINTGTIDPYISLWGVKDTTYLKSKYQKPVIKKSSFKEAFPRRYVQFDRPKLIISGMRHFESFLDEKGEYVAGKSTEILTQKPQGNLKFALGLLNSKLIKFFIKESYNVLGIDGGINFTPDLIKSLPMPSFINDQEKVIVDLVNRILEATKAEDYFDNSEKQAEVQEFEKQIDHMVYKLYGLTQEEVEIVEGNNEQRERK